MGLTRIAVLLATFYLVALAPHIVLGAALAILGVTLYCLLWLIEWCQSRFRKD